MLPDSASFPSAIKEWIFGRREREDELPPLGAPLRESLMERFGVGREDIGFCRGYFGKWQKPQDDPDYWRNDLATLRCARHHAFSSEVLGSYVPTVGTKCHDLYVVSTQKRRDVKADGLHECENFCTEV